MFKPDHNFNLAEFAGLVMRSLFFVVSVSFTLTCSLVLSVHSVEASLVVLIVGMGMMWVVNEFLWGEE